MESKMTPVKYAQMSVIQRIKFFEKSRNDQTIQKNLITNNELHWKKIEPSNIKEIKNDLLSHSKTNNISNLEKSRIEQENSFSGNTTILNNSVVQNVSISNSTNRTLDEIYTSLVKSPYMENKIETIFGCIDPNIFSSPLLDVQKLSDVHTLPDLHEVSLENSTSFNNKSNEFSPKEHLNFSNNSYNELNIQHFDDNYKGNNDSKHSFKIENDEHLNRIIEELKNQTSVPEQKDSIDIIIQQNTTSTKDARKDSGISDMAAKECTSFETKSTDKSQHMTKCDCSNLSGKLSNTSASYIENLSTISLNTFNKLYNFISPSKIQGAAAESQERKISSKLFPLEANPGADETKSANISAPIFSTLPDNETNVKSKLYENTNFDFNEQSLLEKPEDYPDDYLTGKLKIDGSITNQPQIYIKNETDASLAHEAKEEMDLSKLQFSMHTFPQTIDVDQNKAHLEILEVERQMLLEQIHEKSMLENASFKDDANLASKWINLVKERDDLLRTTHCLENSATFKRNLAEMKLLLQETLGLTVCPHPIIKDFKRKLQDVLNMYPDVHGHFQDIIIHSPRNKNPPINLDKIYNQSENQCTSTPNKKRLEKAGDLLEIKSNEEQDIFYGAPDLLTAIPTNIDDKKYQGNFDDAALFNVNKRKGDENSLKALNVSPVKRIKIDV